MISLLTNIEDVDDATLDADLAKKKHVIMLTKNYPKGHINAGKATNFTEAVLDGTKLHTMRDTGQRLVTQCCQVNAGTAYFSLRYWSGRPYHSSPVEVARMYSANFQTIGIKKEGENYSVSTDENQYTPLNGALEIYKRLAKNDGMTKEQLDSWLFKKQPYFGGILLHFTTDKV